MLSSLSCLHASRACRSETCRCVFGTLWPNQVACAQVQNLSGGELQRVAITMALGQPANVYLIDEPSAYLDSEQRIVAAKVGAGSANGSIWQHCRALSDRVLVSSPFATTGRTRLCLTYVKRRGPCLPLEGKRICAKREQLTQEPPGYRWTCDMACVRCSLFLCMWDCSMQSPSHCCFRNALSCKAPLCRMGTPSPTCS